MAYLDSINRPSDIRKLKAEELPLLAEEIRRALICQSSQKGTHLGPCLGVVEVVMALYYVFDMERDKIVFDVSHQSAVHKILSGRKEYYTRPNLMGKISEFTNPAESPFDLFRVGHTSTAVSLASGVVKARDVLGKRYQVIAVVGDGALSGGEAWEGLNYLATIKTPCVVVLNDNEMSISKNQGGLYPHLANLRKTGGKSDQNIFKEMGFDYLYVEQGHDFPALIKAFRQAEKTIKPIIVHVHTVKGKGYLPAEENQEKWHSMKTPFDIETGVPAAVKHEPTYLKIVPEYLLQKAKTNQNMVVITAGTAPSVGLTPDIREKLGTRFIDVGIAEEHAVTMAAAMACNGCRPVVCIYSSFLQRAYDQMMQDVALNKAPIVMVVYGGMMSGNDATHQGIFDIPMLSQIPNITVLAPTTQEEVQGMAEWAINQTERPVIIRLPRRVIKGESVVYHTCPCETIIKKGKGVAVVGLSGFYALAEQVVDVLAQKGVNAGLIKPNVVVPLTASFWADMARDYQIVVTIEDGSVVGGFGDKVAAMYQGSDVKVLRYGAIGEVIDREPVDSIYDRYGLEQHKIARDIMTQINLVAAG